MDKKLTIDETLLNKEFYVGKGLTVGRLKEILAIMPEDNLIIIQNPDEESGEAALNVVLVDTYWHGAVTLSAKPR